MTQMHLTAHHTKASAVGAQRSGGTTAVMGVHPGADNLQQLIQ